MSKPYAVGYTCGVFDMFHVGHLNLLERCKEQCETLIVGLCNDDYVRNVKHHEPVFPEGDRVRILAALRCVDRVELVDPETTSDKMKAWRRFGYDVLFSGDDWKAPSATPRPSRSSPKLVPWWRGCPTPRVSPPHSSRNVWPSSTSSRQTGVRRQSRGAGCHLPWQAIAPVGQGGLSRTEERTA